MCGISGFCNIRADYTKEAKRWHQVLDKMKTALNHRGPDDRGEELYPQAGFAHTRLSIIDLSRGQQPMTKYKLGNAYTIVYNGEIYNTAELRDNLIRMGYTFKTHCDTEVILTGYMAFGDDFVKELNGIFAYAIWDENDHSLHLFRDRLGVKPLFYTVLDDTLIFGSELKALFAFPGMKPRIDGGGLCEVFAIGPAKTYGLGVFKDVYEVLPGYNMVFNQSGLHSNQYWKLVSKPHTDTYAETVDKTSYLLYDSVKRQMISDIPICTFLSGGLDSSLVTAICSKELKKLGSNIDTYSFDFVDNDKNFKANSFQPSQDRPFVDIMKEHVESKHTYLKCDTLDLADYLYDAVDARDLPNMADVEASLLYFCKEVSKHHRVTLTGECADEYAHTCYTQRIENFVSLA